MPNFLSALANSICANASVAICFSRGIFEVRLFSRGHFSDVQAAIDGRGYCMTHSKEKDDYCVIDCKADGMSAGIPCQCTSDRLSRRWEEGTVENHALSDAPEKFRAAWKARSVRVGFIEDVTGFCKPNYSGSDTSEHKNFLPSSKRMGCVPYQYSSTPDRGSQ